MIQILSWSTLLLLLLGKFVINICEVYNKSDLRLKKSKVTSRYYGEGVNMGISKSQQAAYLILKYA